MSELQNLDRQYKDLVGQAIVLAEKLVAGKMGKQQYIDADKGLTAKREELYQKMETLRVSL